MPVSIAFNDGSAAVLTNSKPHPADRLGNWMPDPQSIASRATGLGTGLIHAWVFRTDYLASFELAGIPYTSLDTMQRLKLHAENGGTMVVNVGDGQHIYTCTLAPETKVAWEFSDRRMLEYTLTMTIRNTAAERMLHGYS